MWLAAYLILAISLVAVVGWALQRFRPSIFSRYPGGIEEFRRRGKIVTAVYLAAALVFGGLASGIALLFFGGLAGLVVAILIIFIDSTTREPPSRVTGNVPSPAEQSQRLWQRQLKELAYPYELVSGAEAEAAYEAARMKGRVEGYTPLIITPASWPLAPGLTLDELVTKARGVMDAAPAVQDFFAERMAAWFRYDEDDTRGHWLAETPAFVDQPPTPTLDFNNQMSTLRDTHGRTPPLPYVQEAALVRIPTPRSWEIPAYTLYGGWNDCPNSEQMVAVARYWNEKYGADICALGNGTIEFRVERPPPDLRQALELVREQMLFCDEGVDDLIATPEFFRDTVLNLPKQKYWLFWWD